MNHSIKALRKVLILVNKKKRIDEIVDFAVLGVHTSKSKRKWKNRYMNFASKGDCNVNHQVFGIKLMNRKKN